MKRIFLIIFLGILAFLPLISSAAGLVPFGGEAEPRCQLCHFFVLFRNVVDFLLTKIIPPLAVLMIAIGGFMYDCAYLGSFEKLTGGGKGGPVLLARAKKLIISVVIGLLIIFAAWIIVNTFFQVIGVADWTGLKEGWWQVNKDCPTEASPPGICTPATCASLSKQCGIWYDNCGKYLTCPACGTNQVCNTLGQCVDISQSQTCANNGGSCKTNACDTYTDCSSLSSGTCSSGNCCSGSCEGGGLPPPSGPLGSKTNPIPMNLYGGRGTTYFPSTGNSVPLRANEKKWFVVDSLAITGQSVELFTISFKTYNNSNLVFTKVPQSKATGQDLGPEVRVFGLEPSDTVSNNRPYNLNDIRYLYSIQNNGPATTDHPEPSVYFRLSASPTPSGPLGSKTNPIPINKPTTKVAGGYIPSTSPDNSRGTYVIRAGQKVYFEVDPAATTGRSVSAFGLQIKFYNQSLPVCKSIQDKTTENYSTEVCRVGGYADIVYDNIPYKIDNTKFLYAIDNSSCTSSGCDFTDDIWAEIPE